MHGTRQLDEMVNAWTDVQKTMWDQWIGAAQEIGRPQPAEVWGWEGNKVLDAYGTVVQSTLDAQLVWTRIVIERLSKDEKASREAAEWGQQLLKLAEAWTDAQRRLWESWSETVKKAGLGPAHLVGAWDQAFESWRDAVQKSLDSQRQWGRPWLAGSTVDGEEGSVATPS